MMLSKPKMPSPYNTVVDADGSINYSCILTEGDIGSFLIDISDLYGNIVAQGTYSTDNGFYTVGDKISMDINASDVMANYNEYKWKIRLFEPDDIVSTWCSYGTLQSADGVNDTAVVSVSQDCKQAVIKISAHTNIEISNNKIVPASTFTLHSEGYLVDHTVYDPSVVGSYEYVNDDWEEPSAYQYLVMSDQTSNVNNSSANTITVTGNEALTYHGIIEDITDYNTTHVLVTIYDFNGNIYQYKVQRSSKVYNTIYNALYTQKGNKRELTRRICHYSLSTGGSDGIYGVYRLQVANEDSTEQGVGMYSASSHNFQHDGESSLPLDTQNGCRIISARDYNSSRSDTTTMKNTAYRIKIQGVEYDVVNYEVTYVTGIPISGNMTIKKTDDSVIGSSSSAIEAMFVKDMQYTIYCNYIDSDEYYFKTYRTLQARITTSNTVANTNIITTSHPTFRGSLRDCKGVGVGAKIRSYKWTISIETITGLQEIYSTDYIFDTPCILTYDELVSTGKYYVSLSIITDDNMEYNTEYYFYYQYPDFNTLTGSLSDIEFTVSYQDDRHNVLISWGDDLYSRCMTFAEDFPPTNYQGRFDGISIYKTDDNNYFYKVAEIPADLLNTTLITDTSDLITSIEDFVVGGGNTYEYYLRINVSIIQEATASSDEYVKQYTADTLISNMVRIPVYGMCVIGLVPAVDDDGILIDNQYIIDYENIWHYSLNMTGNSSTFNMAHTFHENQKRYNKVSVAERGYITGSLSALAGEVKCETGNSYIDNIDTLDNWEEFMNNGELKIICDKYGRIFPCDINECSYNYDDKSIERMCTVDFSYTQIADHSDITVLVNNNYLVLANATFLANGHNQILSVVDQIEGNSVTSGLGTARK